MNFDRFAKSPFGLIFVIPAEALNTMRCKAEAGIQLIQDLLSRYRRDRFRRSDGFPAFHGIINKRASFSSPRYQRGENSSLKSLIFIAGMILMTSWVFAQSAVEQQSPAPKKLPYKVAILPMKIHSA